MTTNNKSNQMTITTNTIGQNILIGRCSITGRQAVEAFTVPVLQIVQILKAGCRSVGEAVSVAELRWDKAQAIRCSRAAKAERLRHDNLAWVIFDED
jgi:hypothetical protein